MTTRERLGVLCYTKAMTFDLRPSFACLALTATLFGCGAKQPPAEAPADGAAPAEAPVDAATEEPASSERPKLTADECSAKGGSVVGDIGDGAIHRPDYRCPSGSGPLGSIEASGEGPVAVEGSVCCPG